MRHSAMAIGAELARPRFRPGYRAAHGFIQHTAGLTRLNSFNQARQGEWLHTGRRPMLLRFCREILRRRCCRWNSLVGCIGRSRSRSVTVVLSCPARPETIPDRRRWIQSVAITTGFASWEGIPNLSTLWLHARPRPATCDFVLAPGGVDGCRSVPAPRGAWRPGCRRTWRACHCRCQQLATPCGNGCNQRTPSTNVCTFTSEEE